MNRNLPEYLKKAANDHDQAVTRLRRAVQRAFPIGVTVRATLGGHRIEAVVMDYGASWCDDSAAVLIVQNVATGKRRRVSVLSESVNVEAE